MAGDEIDLQFGCLLDFDSEAPEFARGFEAGRIWALLRSDPSSEVTELVHGANAEMLLRMADATARPVAWKELGDEWFEVHFAAAP